MHGFPRPGAAGPIDLLVGCHPEEDLTCGRELDLISARQAPILQRIVAARAHTRRCIQAKASSLALWDQEEFEAETGCWGRLLVRSLVLDLLKMPFG